MADAKYNGWTNYETWLANLWLGDYWQSVAEDGHTLSADALKDMLEEHVEDECGDLGDSCFTRDLLNGALGAINYRELADHYRVEEDQ